MSRMSRWMATCVVCAALPLFAVTAQADILYRGGMNTEMFDHIDTTTFGITLSVPLVSASGEARRPVIPSQVLENQK